MIDRSPEDFLKGKIKVFQDKSGYRFSVDSVLLAYFIDEPAQSRIIDLGTGCGIIPLILAAARDYQKITGIEIQDSLVKNGLKNVELNELGNNITLIHGDMRDLLKQKSKKHYDAVVCNPPYKKLGTGRLNPLNEKAIARHEIKCTFSDIIKIADAMTVSYGKLYMIYNPFRFDELIVEMSRYGFHIERFQSVHSYPGDPAAHFMVKSAKKSSRETIIEPPIYVRDEKNEYTPYLKSILGLTED